MNKKELRAILKNKRKNISAKDEKDRLIFERLISFDAFKDADCVLCYMSLGDEVKTDGIVSYCLDAGKTVAAPRCLDKKGEMDFYIINSFDDLKEGAYGIREPGEYCEKISASASDAFVIVPGLSFDKKGYRLGYGGGYYDRYIKKHPFIYAGLCYNSLIQNSLPADSYDQRVDYVITESGILGF